MYHEVGVQALSPKQISRLLNGHPVRVKHGSHHKMHLSTEHAKKLHRAHLKGSAITVTLDPYAIEHNQHLRGVVGKARKMLGHGYPIPPHHPVHHLRHHPVHHGAGPKGLKKFQKWTSALGDVAKSVGEYIKPVAKPILEAATQEAVKNIHAYGDANAQQASPMGMGVKRRAKVPKAHRPKRVMSEAQKAALAKGRHALRLRLEEMGAGRKHHGKALAPAGYGVEC
jgi:hypothetical protein